MSAELRIDAAAVRHNVTRLRAVVGVPLMAVVKADGYGHGILEAGRTARAAGADWLGTAVPAEALALREAGDTGPLLCWLTEPGADLAPLVGADVDVTAYSTAELDQVAAAVDTAGRPARLQLKVDTGLSRGGCPPEDWPALVAAAARGEREGRWRVTGVWSHLACSDEPDHPANDAQEAVFRTALAQAEAAGLRPEVVHLANSAGALLRPSARFSLVRCGLAVYGLDPAPGHTAAVLPDLDLRPAMSLRAPLVLVKRVEAGAGVSYGHTWVADVPTTLGLVPVGYGDGVPWQGGNRLSASVRGVRVPVRGRVCMDQVVVDLAGVPGVQPGEEVVLFGDPATGAPSAQEWAEASGTISYDVVTRGHGRAVRRWVDPATDPATDPVTDPAPTTQPSQEDPA